jgi:NADH-quinone oxidoreductase subunit N
MLKIKELLFKMLLAFLLEFVLFVYLIMYMISFFVERDTRFFFFFILQISLFSFFILLSSIPFASADFFFLCTDYFVYGLKFIALCFYILFVFFFYFWFTGNLTDNLIGLEKIQGTFEFLLLSLIFLISGFLFISSNDFLYVYIFLEIQSICLYILAAFQYDTNRSTEASLKYFIFGAIFSGMFLLGWSSIFAITGLSNLTEIVEWQTFISNIPQGVLIDEGVRLEHYYYHKFILKSYFDEFFEASPLAAALKYFQLVQVRFILLGLFFIILAVIGKLGLFPFHLWMIDVYDSVSAITLLFFSVFPKLFLIGFLCRLYFYFKIVVFFDLYITPFMFFIACFSVLWGSISNLSQWKVQRFLAFSSLVNLGYIMFFFSFGLFNSFTLIGVILNLIIYLILVFSFFSVFLFLRRYRITEKIMDLPELFSIKNTHPLIGFSLFLNMLSFAGVPPLVGFFGKFYLIAALWFCKYYIFLFIVLFVSFISAFYYIRVARVFFNFSSVRVFFKDISFGILFINFIFILLQLFFIFFLIYYFFFFFEFVNFIF